LLSDWHQCTAVGSILWVPLALDEMPALFQRDTEGCPSPFERGTLLLRLYPFYVTPILPPAIVSQASARVTALTAIGWSYLGRPPVHVGVLPCYGPIAFCVVETLDGPDFSITHCLVSFLQSTRTDATIPAVRGATWFQDDNKAKGTKAAKHISGVGWSPSIGSGANSRPTNGALNSASICGIIGAQPNFDHPGLIQGISFRLVGSLPTHVLASLDQDNKSVDDSARRERIESYFNAGHGDCHLRDPRIARASPQTLQMDEEVRSMAKIEVQRTNQGDPYEFQVIVKEGGTETRHGVTLQEADYERLCGGKASPEILVRESFRFLLEREPKESILRSFDLAVIGRYFPTYEREITGRMALAL
jgi:hypothetical protein